MPVMRVGHVACFTVDDAAEVLEVTAHQVRRLIRCKTLDRVGTGRPLLVSLASVDRYAKARGPWNRAGVKGGLAAAVRLRVWEVK